MTTRLTSILAILVSGLFLAACQDEGGEESSDSGSSTEESSGDSGESQ